MLVIFIIIVILSVTSFLVKLLLKIFSQNENYYMTNKIINFTLVFLVVMVILFSYIDNVSYLVTILGFASANYCNCFKRLVYVYFWMDGDSYFWVNSSWR